MSDITIVKSLNRSQRRSIKSFRKSSRKSAVKSSLNTTIKRAITRNLEVKQWQFGVDADGLHDFQNVGFHGSNYFGLTPSSVNALVTGMGTSNRVGNKIRVKSAMLKLILYPTAYDVSTNPFPRPYDVRLIIAHSKSTPTALVISSDFFEINNSTAAPSDDLSDMVLNINKNVYVVSYDKRIKVAHASYEGSGSDVANQFQTNNDYKLNVIRNIDITKMLPKNIEWNDAETTPVSFMPNLIMLQAPASGTPSPVDKVALKYYCEITIRYTDA